MQSTRMSATGNTLSLSTTRSHVRYPRTGGGDEDEMLAAKVRLLPACLRRGAAAPPLLLRPPPLRPLRVASLFKAMAGMEQMASILNELKAELTNVASSQIDVGPTPTHSLRAWRDFVP